MTATDWRRALVFAAVAVVARFAHAEGAQAITRPAAVDTAVDGGAPPSDGGPPASVAAPTTTTPIATAAPTAPKKVKAPKRSYVSRVVADPADTLRRTSARTQVTHEEIENAQAESASELLSRVPGLQVRQEDQSGLRLNLGVRGLSPVRSRLVLVEEDGIPVAVSPYGEPELYYMTPIERVQTIDVVKGADALIYGPQTIGAVIKLHTFDPTPDASWLTSFTYGQRNYGQAIARFADTFKGLGVVAQVLYKWGDGYRAMPFSAVDAFVKLHYSITRDSELTLKFAVHDELAHTTYTGLTEAQYLANPRANTIAPNDRFDISRYELGLAHEQRFTKNSQLHSAIFFYQMDTKLRTQDFDRSLLLPNDEYDATMNYPQLHFRNTDSIRNRTYDVLGLSTELQQRFTTGPIKHKLTLGVRGMLDEAHRKLAQGATPTADSGETLTDDTTRIFGVGAWLEDQIALTPWLVVTPVFRLEYEHTTTLSYIVENSASAPVPVTSMPSNCATGGPSSSGCGTQATGWIPGIGMVLGTAKLSAFTSLWRGYSGPRISQAITPTGQDSNLKAETSSNWEFGARGRIATWLRAEADTFLINFDNQLVDNNPFYGSTSEFINGGKTQHIGVEATVKLRLGTAFHLPIAVDLASTYTFIHSRFVGGSFNGHTVPYSPANTANVVLNLAHKIGVSAELAFQYVGAQYSDEQNTVQSDPTGLTGIIPGYTTLDFNVRYRNKRTGLSTALIMKNALDRVYVSDRLPDGIFTAGFREIMGTLAWSSSE